MTIQSSSHPFRRLAALTAALLMLLAPLQALGQQGQAPVAFTLAYTDAQGQAPNIPFWLGEAPGRTDELSLGVSRLHAGLRRHGDTLVLTDLGSLNHTYVNGEQLHPHEVRVLHDGDEIRFGHLVARVYFRHE